MSVTLSGCSSSGAPRADDESFYPVMPAELTRPPKQTAPRAGEGSKAALARAQAELSACVAQQIDTVAFYQRLKAASKGVR